MTGIFHCIYASTATRPMGHAELLGLLEDARAANQHVGLTGMLLYTEGNFFQVLEGPPATLEALLRRIESDARHREVVTIIREPIRQRNFADWTMGFASLTGADLQAVIGSNDFFMSGHALARLGPGRARKLLTAFSQGRWQGVAGRTPVSA